MAEPAYQSPVRILAVIVLYKMRPSESAAFRTLQVAISDLQKVQNDIRILLFDNTPGGCDPGPLPESVQYEAAGQNEGLAAAYNRALGIAQSERYPWLLILDQDTTLPSDYLSLMSKYALDLETDEKIAAIVPRMLDAGKRVSPVFIRFWGVSYISSDFEGTAKLEIHATNSATLFRVDSLKKIGGFSPYFWLDYVDGYVFRHFHLHGLKVYVARDIEVEHELSLLHGGGLKADRFRNILRAESAFWDLYGGSVQRLALAARLLGRIWRQRKRGHDSAILELTWNELKRRIFQSKTRRIHEWMREMEERMLRSSASGQGRESFVERPAVSVCMAAYNGERYITAQLQSILSQLEAQDEVFVVDDASTDRTRECIRAMNDNRVHLIAHSSNLGVSRSFEDAIRAASGEILFLSDQDDLWVADKVSTVLRAFQLASEADIVVSDAALIDENGGSLAPSYYAQRGKFRSGVLANVLRCSYLGCAMAFRSRIRAKILPFPRGGAVLHDLWIGALNSLTGGKALYVDHPLVLYRRHGENATGNRRLPITRQLHLRWDLCRSLAGFRMNSHRSMRDKARDLL